MPSLIYGHVVSWVAASDACDLTVTFAESGRTTTCSGLPSVFSAARELGINTAAVGWYIPYRRLMGHDLNFCEWYPFPPYEPSRATTYLGSLRQQFLSEGETFRLRQLFVDVHRGSLQTSLSLVTNSTYGLELLHLPAPHKPGIYLASKDRLTFWPGLSKVHGYLNNLMLADRELGQLRHAMESAGQWDRSWIILSSDHSWGESQLYDRKHDPRVPFIVKAPGRTEGIAYSRQFNTVLTHDLILAILHGQLTNQRNVADWLDARHSQAMMLPVAGVEQ